MSYIDTDHMCYIIKSLKTSKIYIGYTINFKKRLRQHNGEIVGGAKRTRVGRPWVPICVIRGFTEKSVAMRFEARLQHNKIRNIKDESMVKHLQYVVNNGDGSVIKNNKMDWPVLIIYWNKHNYKIENNYVINI